MILPLNWIPVSCKIDTRAQCNVNPFTILKKSDPEPDLCSVNIKLSTYKNSKIDVHRKCSLTLKHEKDHFDLNLIKCISVVNASDEQILYEFSVCFGEIGTLKNTHSIEMNVNVTPVVTPVRKILLTLKPKL